MTETKNEIRVAKNHKDRLFRMIFREKKELLSLYNAVNGTSYTNAEDLEIVTLENAIYMNMKNDLAFIMDSYLNLYEHQSTYSPNMPLRDLFYIAKELQGQIDHRDLYRNTLIKIPTPRFLVFYNGSEEQAEKKYLRLSDAFQKSMDAPAAIKDMQDAQVEAMEVEPLDSNVSDTARIAYGNSSSEGSTAISAFSASAP